MLDAVILYVGVAALLLVLAMALDQHKVLKFLAVIFCVYVILISGSAAINSATVCDLKLNYTRSNLVYGENFTGYNWDYASPPNPNTLQEIYLFHVNETQYYSQYCYTNEAEKETAKTFYKTVLWFFRLVFVYMFVFMVYTVLTYLGLVGKRGV
jgi:hypothetical protein